jgi:hypothetical protein
VGALPISGGALNGTTIEINNGTAMLYGDANNIVLGTEVDENNKRQLALYNENRQGIKNALHLKDIKNGETDNYLLYGEHNKDSMPFLPFTGGTLSGYDLFLNGGYGLI